MCVSAVDGIELHNREHRAKCRRFEWDTMTSQFMKSVQ